VSGFGVRVLEYILCEYTLSIFFVQISNKTKVSGFGSSNYAVSFVKFQNHLFTPSR
jgi:hypothetical protein